MSSEGKKKALVIAISEYQDFPDLDFVKNDGDKVLDTLDKVGFKIAEQHKLIGKVNNSEMVSAVKNFFGSDDVEGNDTLLFYYSGHGVRRITIL